MPQPVLMPQPVSPVEISIVVPVYREAKNILPFIDRTRSALGSLDNLGVSYEIIFAVDPSHDGTERLIENEARLDPRVKMLLFSRRFGQPAATMSGILACSGNWCAVIDVDLQDPPELIWDLYRKALTDGGYDVVYAQRSSRRGETVVKKTIAWLGYKLIHGLSDLDIPPNTGDFRIISRRVIEELRLLNETHGFLRGLVSFVGFRQTSIMYDRDVRLNGKGKYNRYLGSIRIGLNGLISFSSRPLFVMSIMGVFFAGLSFLLGAWYAFQKFVLGIPLTPGLTTTVLIVSFFSGIQLLSLGLVGEYVGRIYDEVKRRPLSIVDKKVNM